MLLTLGPDLTYSPVMTWFWISLAVVVVALGVWAYWPRKSRAIDGDVERRKRAMQTELDAYRRPDTSGGIGMK